MLCAEDGIYGVDIPKNVWHKLESLEPGSVIFECKEGPFVPHEEEGILIVNRYNSWGDEVFKGSLAIFEIRICTTETSEV